MLRIGKVLMLSLAVVATSSYSLLAQAPEKKNDEPKVELMEKGASPHRQLRFTLKAGEKVTKLMEMKMSQVLTVGGNQAPSPELPGQQMFFEVDTKNVAANGDADYEYLYKDIKIVSEKPSPIVTTTEQMMKPLIGMTGTGTISNRGISKKADFKTPDDLNPTVKGLIDGMKDSISRLSAPVPEEPVGVGAKWKVVQEVNANGIQMTQTTVSEVTEISSTGFTVKSTITQTAPAQEVKNPMLPAGATMKLDSLSTEGSGQSKYNFNHFMPKSSKVDINSKTSMKMSIAGQNQSISTDMKMSMTVEDAPKK